MRYPLLVRSSSEAPDRRHGRERRTPNPSPFQPHFPTVAMSDLYQNGTDRYRLGIMTDELLPALVGLLRLEPYETLGPLPPGCRRT